VTNVKASYSRIFAAALLVLAGLKSFGAIEMFIKVGDIVGDVQDSRHPGESAVASWSWGMQSVIDPLSGVGKLNAEALTLTKSVDRASPALMRACASGEHFPRAVLTLRKAGQTTVEFYRIVLEDVLVSNVANNGSTGSETLMESLSLSFGRVGVEYFMVTASGAPGERKEFAWDLVANKAGGVTFPSGTGDADGDGLPDAWEKQFGLDLTVNDAGLDKDRDGATNWEEFVAGTSPVDYNQVLRASLSRGRSEAVLTWPTVVGKTYRVWTSPNIEGGFRLWQTVEATTENSTLTAPLDLVRAFFRIEVAP
jgi:type VI secretion system secreted protein Hcp